jgi:hypothetical protein
VAHDFVDAVIERVHMPSTPLEVASRLPSLRL